MRITSVVTLRSLPAFLCLALAAGAVLALAAEPDDSADVVFRSDVSLVRVDTQVVDRNNRAITGLQREDFVLLEDGKPMDIRNFANEDMPVDVLILLDVSGSMQSHIQRLSSAAHQALKVLGPDDRVAVMVFDRATRLRLPFRTDLNAVEREFENVLHQESFNGGTDINRGILDAAAYIGREGRKEARRAIVILTDDQTERGRDEDSATRALNRADSVLSAILAPDAMRGYNGGIGRRGGGMGGGGLGGGPLGGIIFGRRGPYGGGGRPSGPVIVPRNRTTSAGTAEIAQQTGGDSMSVDDASAFETTLSRIRQRYALHFNLAQAGETARDGNIEVRLADAAQQRYPGSEIHYRRIYSDGGGKNEPVMISRTPAAGRRSSSSNDRSNDSEPSPALRRRRPPVNEDGTAIGNSTPAGGGWPRADAEASASSPDHTSSADSGAAPAVSTPETSEPQPPQKGGWRRVKPGEEP